MLTEANGEVWGKPGPAGWATRWVLGTALGQIVFTGTVRLVLAVLMGAALGGLAVWLVLRRRPTPRRYDCTPTAGATGRPARPVRHDATPPTSGADRSTTTRNSAYPGRQSRPPAGRVRPRFSPRADGTARPTGDAHTAVSNTR